MLGSYVSAAYVTRPDDAGRRFFSGLLDWAGVERPVAVSGDPVEVRLTQAGAEHVVFVLNHAPAPATATVALRVPLAGRAVFALATGEPVTVTPTTNGFEWKGTLRARDVLVLRIAKTP
jgi:hypothetical protein